MGGAAWIRESQIYRRAISQFPRPTIFTITAGYFISLTLNYERSDPFLKTAILDVIIRDAEETIYQGTNVTSGGLFDPLFDSGQFCVHFEYLPANVDYLVFLVPLLDSKTGEMLDWKRNIKLHIKRSSTNHGKLVLPSKWTNKPSVALITTASSA